MQWPSLLLGLLATHTLLFLGGLIMLLLLAGMLRRQRNPAASAAWLVFMISVPYAGVPLYLFFGNRKLKALENQQLNPAGATEELASGYCTGLHRLLAGLNVPPPSVAEQVLFHGNATQAHKALLDILDAARNSIDIGMFILTHDQTGRDLLARLTRRANEGIRIRLLLDSVGSFYLFRSHVRQLTNAGAQVVWFMPVLHVPLRGQTNLRNHRKLAIVDNNQVWTGGRNLGDDYLKPESQTQWIDLSFSLRGPVAADYVHIFNADWAFATHQAPPVRSDSYSVSETGNHLSQLLPSGPNLKEDVLHDALVRLCMEARARIILVTPYFVPSDILQSMLCVAVRSGVKVEILLPAKSNHRLADIARQRFLRQLHGAGALIHCVPDAMLHAKAVVIDDRYALAGSANFDLRSLYLNFELMTLFYSKSDITILTHWIEGIQATSVLWQPPAPGVAQETLEGLALIAAFQL